MAKKITDWTATSGEWQALESRVIILPVGAMEQHSRHLPVGTDAMHGEYFGRYLAGEIGAALLPTMRIASSLEHSGCRGSFSLHPETAMQVVRDLAEEAGKQRFRVLLVLNSHGGNYFLGPVVRDINRSDRPLKIFLVNLWEHFHPEELEDLPARKGPEIHSGMIETARLLAIHPDLVKDERTDFIPESLDGVPFTQHDLNHFGIGAVSPDGVWGEPSKATREMGERVHENAKKHLVKHVRERLPWFDGTRPYGGRSQIAIRRLCPTDIPEAMRLKDIAGWNQTERDWEVLLDMNPDGCVAAVHNGLVVGTTTATRYGDALAWIGMVLVDPDYRRLGIAARLLDACLEKLDPCASVRLDATPQGRPLYEKAGFSADYEVHRMLLPAAPAAAPDAGQAVGPLSPDHIDDLAAFDANVFGADRSSVLRAWLQGAPHYGLKAIDNGPITGYVLGRAGVRAEQLGPLVAPDAAAAANLFGKALAAAAGRPVLVDVPLHDEAWITHLRSLGFVTRRTFTRMTKGDPAPAPGRQYAFAGPAIG